MKRLLCLLAFLILCAPARAQTSFATADTVSAGITKTGTVNGTTTKHYFKAGLPGLGIFRLTTATANGGSSFGIVQYRIFWKNGNSVTSYNVARNPSTSGADTFMVGCLQADSLYILVDNIHGGQSQTFSLRFDILAQAPNNEAAANETLATAETLPAGTLRAAHISFATPAGTDVYDYYRIVLPRSGTLKLYTAATLLHTSGAGPAPRLHIYDKAGNPVSFFRAAGGAAGYQEIGAAYGPAFTSAVDTMSLYGRAQDTLYLMVNNYHFGLGWPYPASYSLSWTMADTAMNNEPLPNETRAQAPVIAEGAAVQGDISYVSSSGTDLDDYYRIVMAKDATISLYVRSTNTGTRQSNPAPVIYVLDKAGNPLTVQNNAGAQSGALRVANNGSVPFLGTVSDTMHVFGRAADTFFVRVHNYHFGLGWPYAGQYTLMYRLTDTATYNEAEPNDTRQTAQAITPADTVRGKVNYTNAAGGTDIDDLFRIVKPAGGAIRLYISARNNWGYAATSWAPGVWAYDWAGNPLTVKSATGASAGNGLRVRNNYFVPYGATATDTMRIDCVASDTLYLKIQNYFNYLYGGWAADYTFRYEYLPPAKSGIEYARTGNEFGFINRAVNATGYLWIMGNGQQHSSYHAPLTTYGPGNYDVKLVAIDAACNYRDTAKVNITVAGIEYYTPKRAGRGGDAILEVFGGALDTATVVRLVQGGTVLTPRAKYINTRLNHLTADFDLHTVPTGAYDVVLQVPGQAPVTYPGGFFIEGFEYPYAWSQVKGPSRIRSGVDNPFSLLVGNRGNVTASGVVVAMLWPKSVQLTWKAAFHKPDYSKNDTLVTDTATYIFPNEIYRYIYDSSSTTVAIDSFEGQPYDGYIRFLQIPHLPARGSIEIPFIAHANTPSALRFITYAHHPNFLGSCPSGNYEDYGNDIAAELIDAADMVADQSKMPFLQAFTKSAKIGQKHMQSASSYLGKEFWAWYDGYEADHDAYMADWLNETEANNEFAMNTAVKEAGSAFLKLGVAKAKYNNDQIAAVNRMLANNPNMSPKTFDATMRILNRLGRNAPGVSYDRLKLLTEIFENTVNAADLSERILKLQQLIDECPELQDQLRDLENQLNQELHHRDVQPTHTDAVTSFDPNDITGPTGFDTARYLNNVRPQPFMIHFENADTAAADAQEVVVRDTIDRSRFDIHSLAFGDIFVGTQHLRVPHARQQFVIEQRLDSIPGMRLRVTVHADTAAGVVTWRFTSIDSATMGRPLLHGFLPPNIRKPEGEGSVGYTITPLSTLPDAAVLQSKASIYFDDNAPIATGTWTNTLDIAPPVSSITGGSVRNDTVIRLDLSGSDASSGLRAYRIHCSINGGPWRIIGQSTADSAIILGSYDSSYRFYVTALDRVGNAESKTPAAEYAVTMPAGAATASLAARGASMSLYPNPASGRVSVQVLLQEGGHLTLQLQSLTGQTVRELYSGQAGSTFTRSFDISGIPEGVYLLQLRTAAGGSCAAKLVVIH